MILWRLGGVVLTVLGTLMSQFNDWGVWRDDITNEQTVLAGMIYLAAGLLLLAVSDSDAADRR